MPEKYLIHYGIKGMKWGKRRFQNKDGSLTPAGIRRYSEGGGDDNAAGSGRGPQHGGRPHHDRGQYLVSRGGSSYREFQKMPANAKTKLYSQTISADRAPRKAGPADDWDNNNNIYWERGSILDTKAYGTPSKSKGASKTDINRSSGGENKNSSASLTKRERRQAPGSDTMERSQTIAKKTESPKGGKPIDTSDPRYILKNNAFRVNEQRDPKTGELLWRYRTRKVDGWNNEGTGGATYMDSKTGKKYLVPHGEKVNPVTGKESSASSSQNNPARYGNFEQQKRDAARASKSKAGTKKSSLTTKAKQTISQATQQASQSVQKASDWLKKLFGKK